MKTRSLKQSVYIGILLSLLAILSCSGKEETPRTKLSFENQRTNVLLITLDTVRADALRVYDPQGAPVPNLQELARRGIVFENSVSQIPYTLPSHSSMFTSHYPISHGVIDNLRGVLPHQYPTLAECFRKQGYQTSGFAASLVLSHATGINRGFEFYDDYFSKVGSVGSRMDRIERNAEEVVSSFQNWYERRDPSKNFFAFLHFYDAHAPYEPPAAFYPTQNGSKERYLGEIRYIDSILGKLFNYLDKEKGAFANTIILVESDHGEMFQEHQEIGHGFFLYEPVLRVPFILYIPSLQKSTNETTTIPDLVQLVDIAPTLLDLADIPVPLEMQGESLVPLLRGNPKKNTMAFSETYLAALDVGVSPIFAIQDLRYKYIETARPEFYELPKDPGESINLIESDKSIVKQYKQQLSSFKKQYASNEKSNRDISTEEAEKLAALGYLGGDISPEDWNYQKDAKDYVAAWNQLTNIKLLIGKRQYAEALPVIEKTKMEMPSKKNTLLIDEADCYSGMGNLQKAEELLTSLGTPETKLPLAEIYLKTGRKEQAVELYRKEIHSNSDLDTLFNYVLILKLAGKKQDALKTLEEIRVSNRDPNELKTFLAETFYAIGEWNEAETYCLELIQERHWEWKWYSLLCDAYEKQKQYVKALELLEQAQSRFVDQPAYLLKAGILFRLTNQSGSAVRAFSRMIQLSPRDPAGYIQLAAEMVTKKYKVDEAIGYAQKGLGLHPNHDLQILGHSVLHNAFQQKGNLQEAKQQFEIVKRLKGV